METLIPNETILQKIILIRNQKIILDSDLAQLYRVETKSLKRQVKRNIDRFPDDFMFELTPEEVEILRCQFGTSSWGGSRYIPMAFTEQGVAMLSSVLSSDIAIQVNIQIIRIFSGMRELLSSQQELLQKVNELEDRMEDQDEKIMTIFECMKELLREAIVDRPVIGFKQETKPQKPS
ncbi:MAG: DNA-binding protein [Candidatus Fluviicola riflensis]|nr:MAG: DNA-binding protein [Candidatus Fluviicola riflensis]OGS76303.1 MAG: DNA-binding protein [Candidatus Fluviicola riflensis]OGS83153.1 MAG: DNA-binding protein [Fluviicola sp. RIFCSPHIGHO2_01_FULL_43_53]OGS83835.1 MAG: DNA-binding protein [Fluviicola sp. RIFCSPHIGHO2_12_FULL_43_24]